MMPSSGSVNNRDKFHWVEFKTLKGLFSFVATKSILGQQFLSLIRFREYTYAMAPVGDVVLLFLTKEEPKSRIYSWDSETGEFVAQAKADRSRINIMVEEVAHDTIVEGLFYSGK